MKLINRKTAAPRAPELPPVTLDRRKIYVLPTRYGVIFIAICGLMLFGSINYNNNLGFLLCFLLGGMGFVSIFHTWRTLMGVTILSAGAQPVFAGETAVFEIVAQGGEKTRPLIAFKMPEGEESVQDLEANAITRVRVGAPTFKRGVFSPETIQISTQYPLGVFKAWANLYPMAECLVYPRPLFESLDRYREYGTGSDEGTFETSGSDDFKELRPYQPGDPIRHVSWKAFSRGQGLISKAFIGTIGSAIQLDYNMLSDSEMEERLSKLCGMILLADREDAVYGLTLPDREYPPDKGESHKRSCLKALALFGGTRI